jgi:peptide deformylase
MDDRARVVGLITQPGIAFDAEFARPRRTLVCPLELEQNSLSYSSFAIPFSSGSVAIPSTLSAFLPARPMESTGQAAKSWTVDGSPRLYLSHECMSDFSPSSLSIIPFPHPTLRYVAKPIRRVTPELRLIADRMFELMYEHRGVGLAATQVDLPIRMFVMNATGQKGEGEELVIINPVVSRPRSNEEAEEGCLSLPGIHGNVVRAKTIHVNAFDISGKEIDADISGFEARVVQHETDHLNGMLFIDRLKEGAEVELADRLEALVNDFHSLQRTESIPSDEALLAKLAHWESKFC